MAHATYRYFAQLAREAGADDVAQIFEASADRDAAPATELVAEGDVPAPVAGDPAASRPRVAEESACGEQPADGLRRALALAAGRIARFGGTGERHGAHRDAVLIPASS